MKNLLLPLCLLLVVAQLAPPADVPGWQDARWGMTLGELQKVYGASLVKRERDYAVRGDEEKYAYADYYLPLEITGEKFRAGFLMDVNTDKLIGVRVQTAEDKKYPSEAEGVFEDIEKALGQKYGPAGFADEERSRSGGSKVRRWTFPTTTIELKAITGYFNLVVINYTPTRNKDADKL